MYPMRSQYPTLFESLGRAPNAPLMTWCFNLVESRGSAVGYAVIAALTGVMGVVLGLVGWRFAALKDKLYEELGPIKYAILIGLLLCMMGVLGKVVLRLLFGVKYLISIPAFSFNI